MGKNINELQEEYETEFSEFLRQKINHAGGSLQFQHLSGLLPQLRFEIRNTFGVTKPALMKFLKTHSNIFKVNSKGIVTIIDSSTVDITDSPETEENEIANISKAFSQKIKKGKGFIFKIFPDFAIIKARNPINRYIFFTPVEYGGEKDSIFHDFNLNVRDEVYFNAIHGHSDYEIEYRATEVWRHYDSDEENQHLEDLIKSKIVKPNQFIGEGIIKKLYPNVGFIAVSDKGNNRDVFFYRNNIKDHNIKLRDQVEFIAEFISGEWQAIKIIKKRKKSINESSDHSQACVKTNQKHSVTEELKNEPGKIYPYAKGAIIKFGKNYSEIADGNTCNYYLYGFRVANQDIAVEFSEGDDVKFDAIKSKNSPKWKAVLVWVGEKPFIAENDKKYFEINSSITENINNMDLDEAALDVSSEASDSILKTKKINNNKVFSSVNKGRKLSTKNETRFDSSGSRNFNRLPDECHKNDFIPSKTASQKLPQKDSKYNQNKSKKKRKNRRSNNKYNQDKPFQNRYKNTKNEINNETMHISEKNDLYMSESSESTSEEDNKLQDFSNFRRKFLVEDKQCLTDASEDNNNLENETYSDHESDKKSSDIVKTFAKRKSSIKKFEAIDGEITTLYCKFAIIKSDHLTKDVDFILNVFYLDGKSAEEQEITDLKEIIKKGDIIKFNCIEIIDDFGEIHQKVTLAWKGPKPDAHEINPEQFILEEELSVSIGKELDYECDSEENLETTDFDELNSEEQSLINRTEDNLDQCFQTTKINMDNANEQLSLDIEPEKLPDQIFKKLEMCGFTSSEPEVALSAVQEIIELVLKNSNTEEVFNLAQDSAIRNDSPTLCSSCGKINEPSIKEIVTTANAEVQTVISGEIYTTSIFTEYN